MTDYINFDIYQGIESLGGQWYRNVQLLGTGGNAVTFLVLCTSGSHEGVLFALKVFRKLSAPDRRERFLEEVNFLQECDHPSLMRVFDRGEFVSGQDSFPFVVAEYLPLRLFDVIRSNQASITLKISFSMQLLSALSYLEALQPAVVHRDIKPKNIFVKGGSCVLGDFGLMKLLDDEEDQDREIFTESAIPGMPFYYRTPDLIEYANHRRSITCKSDVFQLGLVLTELFTGRNPAIKSNNYLEPLQLEEIGNVPGALSGGVVGLLRRMLTIDSNQRPRASELLDGWQGLFRNAVEKSHDLEGKAI